MDEERISWRKRWMREAGELERKRVDELFLKLMSEKKRRWGHERATYQEEGGSPQAHSRAKRGVNAEEEGVSEGVPGST